jgi:DNA uptake protein ComE-like DNA-binding protein
MNLNTATLDQLSGLACIGEAAAYDLELWRPFLEWSEVESIPGFDSTRVAALRLEGVTIALDTPQAPAEADRAQAN